MDIFSPKIPRSSERANEIKEQIAAELRLDEHATVIVSELACKEEGCPPVETVIAVFRPDLDKLQFRLHRPIAEISAHDISELCAQHSNSLRRRIMATAALSKDPRVPVTVLTGFLGSGKTTLLNTLPSSTRGESLCPDAMRGNWPFGSQASGSNPMLSRRFRLRSPLSPGRRMIV